MRRGLNGREQGWGRAEVLLTPLSAAAPLCLLWPRGNGYMICWDLFAGSSKQLIALSNAPASDLPGSVWSRHKDKAALPGGLNVWVPRKDQFAPVVNQVPFPVLLKLKLLLDSPPQGTQGLCVSLGVCQHGNTPCPAGSSAHLHGTRLTPALLCPPPRPGCCRAVGQAGTAEAWPVRAGGQDREMQVLQSSGAGHRYGSLLLLSLIIIIIITVVVFI